MGAMDAKRISLDRYPARALLALACALITSLSHAQTIRLDVDFDSMPTGVVDTVGSTSPTLAEVNAATFGGSWDFSYATGVPYIRHDLGGAGDQALDVRSGSGSGTAAGLDFDTPIIPHKISSADPAVIAFETSQRNGTGYERDSYWRLYSDTTLLFTLTLDDGTIKLNGAGFGSMGVGPNTGLANWDSTSPLVWPVSFSIYPDGQLDIVFGGAETNTTISTTATVDRLEIAWKNTNNGIYLNDITITDPAPQGTLVVLR